MSLVSWTISNFPPRPLVTEREKRKINYLDHIVSTDIKSNQVNEVIYNEVKFYSRNSLANNTVNYPLPIVTLSLRGGKSIDRL